MPSPRNGPHCASGEEEEERKGIGVATDRYGVLRPRHRGEMGRPVLPHRTLKQQVRQPRL